MKEKENCGASSVHLCSLFQNSDHGTLNGHPVHRVIRDGPNTAVHFVEAAPEDEFEVGEAVCQVVDWERRFQNMQQHSGQHLVHTER